MSVRSFPPVLKTTEGTPLRTPGRSCRHDRLQWTRPRVAGAIEWFAWLARKEGLSVYDFAVVGGGIVGLSTARALLSRYPDAGVVVLEKEPDWAHHQTGHNSGVIHSGIYYKPGSLKARICKEGAQRLVGICREYGISYEICGKGIVATEPREMPRLRNLYERGVEN